MPYHRRIVDDLLDDVEKSLAAISLEGPRGIGKTTTALERTVTAWRLDDPAELEIMRAAPERLDTSDTPVLIDEWQVEPSVWDRVRRLVDEDSTAGRFWLTGSALPLQRPTHSGAGRIVSIRMRPLTLVERWDAPDLLEPTVSLSELLTGSRPSIEGETLVGLERYVEEIATSGLPSIRSATGRANRLALASYVEAALTSDFEAVGYKTRVPAALRRWAAAYAAATSTTASWRKINKAAEPGEDDVVSAPTAAQFREALLAIGLLDDLPAWSPSLNLLSELAQSPKHHLADPALAVALTNVSPGRLLGDGGPRSPTIRDGTFLGSLFESLATLSVRVYAEAAEATTGHLRVRNGRHEVDLVVEGRDSAVVAIEVKLSATVDDRDVKHLLWLDRQLRQRETAHPGLADMVVLTTGKRAYRRADGVAVVPLALLGP